MIYETEGKKGGQSDNTSKNLQKQKLHLVKCWSLRSLHMESDCVKFQKDGMRYAVWKNGRDDCLGDWKVKRFSQSSNFNCVKWMYFGDVDTEW